MNTNTCFIRNARIYHTATRSFSDGSLLVENGRITALYPADATPPAGVPMYDAKGRRLIPGLSWRPPLTPSMPSAPRPPPPRASFRTSREPIWRAATSTSSAAVPMPPTCW